MANILIVHGTKGSPKVNWFPWLKSELEALGHKVLIPKFPTPKDQSLGNWMKVFDEHKNFLDKDSMIVAHSLGPAFVLSILETLDAPIKKSFFVAGFTGLLGIESFDTLNETFTTKEFDWDKIKKNCKEFLCIHGDDDPYVQLEKGKDLAEHLDAPLLVIEKGGHLNAEFGYTEFPELLKHLKGVL